MTEKLSNPKYDESLSALLGALDTAPAASGEPFLKKAEDKEYYETIVMFAVRKRESASYHLESVRRRLATDVATHESKSESVVALVSKDTTVIRSQSAEFAFDYIHELSAFLSAIRSGLDFIAKIAARNLPGTTASSVKTLMDMSDKGQTSPILSVISKHKSWLSGLRDYRDEVIHRRVVSPPLSGWVVSHRGKTSTAILPVVVPAMTPKSMRDTRRSRMMDLEWHVGLDHSEKTGSVTLPDGTEQALEHEIKYFPSKGYVRIEEFMSDHLANYDEFFDDMLRELIAANFKFVTLTKG